MRKARRRMDQGRRFRLLPGAGLERPAESIGPTKARLTEHPFSDVAAPPDASAGGSCRRLFPPGTGWGRRREDALRYFETLGYNVSQPPGFFRSNYLALPK